MKRKQKKKAPGNNIHSASFRDPSGFLFWDKNRLFRQVNKIYKQNYNLLIDNGLYKYLTKHELLIPHDELTLKHAKTDTAYKIIEPKRIPFISYPYEWCFSQLKDAALLTLKIQKTSLAYNMSLKDASAYNIQFHNGKPILIDTLSFEKYEEGKPWAAYRQFCQHFLAPLALSAYTDIQLNKLMRIYIDGIPLDLTSKLLPRKTWLNLGILSHLHLHAKTQQRYENKTSKYQNIKTSKLPKKKFLLLLDNLISTIQSLRWTSVSTEWGDYYEHTNYTKKAFQEKKRIVSEFIEQIKPKTVWDLGSNTGEFSRISANTEAYTLAFDVDPLAVEKNYQQVQQNNEKKILPLVMDFFNPSPALGWAHEERDSLLSRSTADMVLALALVHHLAISNNVPLEKIAELFVKLGKYLIIEFVPKKDSQVQKLLSTREDIFTNYTEEGFEKTFSKYFQIDKKQHIADSNRSIYLMSKA